MRMLPSTPYETGADFHLKSGATLKFAHLVLSQTKIEYGIKCKIFKYAMKWIESFVTLQSSVTSDL